MYKKRCILLFLCLSKAYFRFTAYLCFLYIKNSKYTSDVRLTYQKKLKPRVVDENCGPHPLLKILCGECFTYNPKLCHVTPMK